MNQKRVMALEIARRLEQRGLIDAAAHWYALANQVSVAPSFVRFAALLSHCQEGEEGQQEV
jgi:hypothetical protein